MHHSTAVLHTATHTIANRAEGSLGLTLWESGLQGRNGGLGRLIDIAGLGEEGAEAVKETGTDHTLHPLHGHLRGGGRTDDVGLREDALNDTGRTRKCFKELLYRPFRGTLTFTIGESA